MRVATAMELHREGMNTADVILAVGLPFTDHGSDKQKLIDYYMAHRWLDYTYEDEVHRVNIVRVIVCPQCYSAIAFRLGSMKDDNYLVCDIGSKTTDIVRVDRGKPIESSSITIDKAMVKWVRNIQRDICDRNVHWTFRLHALAKVQMNKEVPEEEILRVILHESNHLPAEYYNFITSRIADEIELLELEMAERGYNLDYTRIIYVGGGAFVVQRFAKKQRPLTYCDRNVHRTFRLHAMAYEKDLCANARGYEFLAAQIMRKKVG